MEKKWYILQAMSGKELTAKKNLERVVAQNGFSELFGDILVPTEEVAEIKSGTKRVSTRKFFPGYVLVNMQLTDETWHLVKRTTGILNFIGGTGNKPVSISEKEVKEILNKIEEGQDNKPKPKTLFEKGQVIRVIEGPFADFSGTVEEVNYEKDRLRVAVLIFGRSTPVDLNFSQVEKE